MALSLFIRSVQNRSCLQNLKIYIVIQSLLVRFGHFWRKKEAKNVFRILNHKRRLSFINRFLYEKLNDDQMYGIVNKLSKSNDPISILSGVYGWNTKNILRWIKLKYRFEIHPT